MTQYTEYSATVQVATGKDAPSIKTLTASLRKLAKTVPVDARITVEPYTYGYVENGPKYAATRVVARWSRYE